MGLGAGPVARTAAGFLDDRTIGDICAAVHALDHVNDVERSNVDGGQCFHFHAGAIRSAYGGFDPEVIVVHIEGDFAAMDPDRVR